MVLLRLVLKPLTISSYVAFFYHALMPHVMLFSPPVGAQEKKKVWQLFMIYCQTIVIFYSLIPEDMGKVKVHCFGNCGAMEWMNIKIPSQPCPGLTKITHFPLSSMVHVLEHSMRLMQPFI